MKMPSIRLSDDTYKKIKADADIERRSVPAQIEMMYDHYHLDLVPREYPLPPKIEDENPENIVSPAAKEKANAEHIGRREAKSEPQLLHEIELIKQRYAEEAEFCQDQEQLKNLQRNMEAEIAPIQAEIDRLNHN